ncbi:MAG: glycosyltransferase family 4 protein [Actinobacteria bacterium]|nr:glycosyltransferase family 4 protein [Actinomycetota bacterium]
MTRIAIDADVLGRRRTGDETYIASLLRELAGAPEEIFAVTRRPDLVPSGIEPSELPARNQIVRMTLSFPRLLRRLNPDLAHFLYAIPPGYRGRAVVTVHDLSFEHLPDVMGFKDRLLFRTQVPRSVRRADRVLTGSELTKRDLIERYGIAEERIAVTPYGVDSIYSPEGPRHDGHYALFVGAIQPRKDPLTALEALAMINGDLRLIVVGQEKLGGERVRETIGRLGLEERVELAGHVERDQLAALYRGAALLVAPSRYEGFGLTVLEAMASGTPVVAARAGAIPEVAGDAAVLVEPGDPVALAGGIERALADRERLVAAGLERAARYSWAETARQTLDVYRELT